MYVYAEMDIIPKREDYHPRDFGIGSNSGDKWSSRQKPDFTGLAISIFNGYVPLTVSFF